MVECNLTQSGRRPDSGDIVAPIKRVMLRKCRSCYDSAMPDKLRCQKHLSAASAYTRQRTAMRRKKGRCLACGGRTASSHTVCIRCRDAHATWMRRRKILVLTHYGKSGKLQCCWYNCGITDPDMLSLDHVNDNGAEHRGHKRSAGSGGPAYAYIIREGFPKGFQTLCHNHQWKKQIAKLKKMARGF